MSRYTTLSALLATAFLPAVALAASVSLTNLPAGASSCTYTAVSGDGSGNVSYTCESSSQPSAGTLSLQFAPQAPTSIVTGTGTTTIQLQRSGATQGGGAASGTVGITGGCTLTPAGGAVSFADAENRTDSYTVAAGQAAGGSTCSVTLTGVTGASVGTSQRTVNVTTTPPPPPSGCPAFSGRTFVWAGSQVRADPINVGTAAAIEVNTETLPLLQRTSYFFSVVPPSGSSSVTEGVEASLSLCPGDFSGPSTYGKACGFHVYPGATNIGQLSAAVGRTLSRWESYSICGLPAATKLYLNLRNTKPDGSGANSCTGNNCPLWVNISR